MQKYTSQMSLMSLRDSLKTIVSLAYEVRDSKYKLEKYKISS